MPTKRGLGWKRSPVDARDRLHMPRMTSRRLPRRVDLSHLLPPVLNQGETNTCGPHAVSSLIMAEEKSQTFTLTMPSRLFVYWCSRLEMGDTNSDDGVENRAMLRSLNREGWCPEEDWAFNPAKVRVEPSEQCFADAAPRRIYDYASVSQNLWHVCATLASGRPFLLGFYCWESLFDAGVEKTGDIPMPAPGEKLEGGHDVLCHGYDLDLGKVLIRNSWGEEWGQGGNGTIPLAYALDPQRAGDWWVVRSLPSPHEPQVARLPRHRLALAV